MLHFVLSDVNPEKVTQFESFLKEMNDLLFLVSIGQGPFINSKNLISDEQGVNYRLEAVENDYKVVFTGIKSNEKVKTGNLEVLFNNKSIITASYSVVDNHPISIRFIIDNGGEDIARKELERAFKRQISHKSISLINQKAAAKVEITTFESQEEIFHNDIAESQVNPTTSKDDFETRDEDIELSEDLENLSKRILHSIVEVNEMIILMNNLSHDFTRGASPDLSEIPLEEQELENGAKIQLIDLEENGYKLTFRKGSLDNIAEVSYFLEKDEELIFSVYFSSTGTGKIVVGGTKSDLLLKKLKSELDL